ncbi:hypothetical protein BC831DRAFT_453223 [Entophlyctis helioformis]|nr:hypothetical protein BC831DRAFT_453223 [Entophlyctis helioformis]
MSNRASHQSVNGPPLSSGSAIAAQPQHADHPAASGLATATLEAAGVAAGPTASIGSLGNTIGNPSLVSTASSTIISNSRAEPRTLPLFLSFQPSCAPSQPVQEPPPLAHDLESLLGMNHTFVPHLYAHDPFSASSSSAASLISKASSLSSVLSLQQPGMLSSDDASTQPLMPGQTASGSNGSTDARADSFQPIQSLFDFGSLQLLNDSIGSNSSSSNINNANAASAHQTQQQPPSYRSAFNASQSSLQSATSQQTSGSHVSTTATTSAAANSGQDHTVQQENARIKGGAGASYVVEPLEGSDRAALREALQKKLRLRIEKQRDGGVHGKTPHPSHNAHRGSQRSPASRRSSGSSGATSAGSVRKRSVTHSTPSTASAVSSSPQRHRAISLSHGMPPMAGSATSSSSSRLSAVPASATPVSTLISPFMSPPQHLLALPYMGDPSQVQYQQHMQHLLQQQHDQQRQLLQQSLGQPPLMFPLDTSPQTLVLPSPTFGDARSAVDVQNRRSPLSGLHSASIPVSAPIWPSAMSGTAHMQPEPSLPYPTPALLSSLLPFQMAQFSPVFDPMPVSMSATGPAFGFPFPFQQQPYQMYQGETSDTGGLSATSHGTDSRVSSLSTMDLLIGVTPTASAISDHSGSSQAHGDGHASTARSSVLVWPASHASMSWPSSGSASRQDTAAPVHALDTSDAVLASLFAFDTEETPGDVPVPRARAATTGTVETTSTAAMGSIPPAPPRARTQSSSSAQRRRVSSLSRHIDRWKFSSSPLASRWSETSPSGTGILDGHSGRSSTSSMASVGGRSVGAMAASPYGRTWTASGRASSTGGSRDGIESVLTGMDEQHTKGASGVQGPASQSAGPTSVDGPAGAKSAVGLFALQAMHESNEP